MFNFHLFSQWKTRGPIRRNTASPDRTFPFAVDSGASMHMISKKDLSNAEMDTLTKSCSPTIVKTANGEVQTHEEATVYVKELDIFLTMKVLENTPAVLSLGKLCDEHGYSYEYINGQKPLLIKNGIRIQCDTENFVPIVVPWFINEFFLQLSSFRKPTLSLQRNARIDECPYYLRRTSVSQQEICHLFEIM